MPRDWVLRRKRIRRCRSARGGLSNCRFHGSNDGGPRPHSLRRRALGGTPQSAHRLPVLPADVRVDHVRLLKELVAVVQGRPRDDVVVHGETDAPGNGCLHGGVSLRGHGIVKPSTSSARWIGAENRSRPVQVGGQLDVGWQAPLSRKVPLDIAALQHDGKQLRNPSAKGVAREDQPPPLRAALARQQFRAKLLKRDLQRTLNMSAQAARSIADTVVSETPCKRNGVTDEIHKQV
mmetsp:Transcript_24965/g.74449  ORF Transcript_24965/g.74449 Transcript_24965/m.74449 type:complete len:235 (-) Transcript_24965:665-1369(-)